jgi:hypothetical protein
VRTCVSMGHVSGNGSGNHGKMLDPASGALRSTQMAGRRDSQVFDQGTTAQRATPKCHPAIRAALADLSRLARGCYKSAGRPIRGMRPGRACESRQVRGVLATDGSGSRFDSRMGIIEKSALTYCNSEPTPETHERSDRDLAVARRPSPAGPLPGARPRCDPNAAEPQALLGHHRTRLRRPGHAHANQRR